MIRAIALVFLMSGPAYAGDTAPKIGYLLWPDQPPVVIEAEVHDEAWWLAKGITQERLLWAVFDGGSPEIEQPPAPVPVPPAGLLLLTAAIAALIWKGSNRV